VAARHLFARAASITGSKVECRAHTSTDPRPTRAFRDHAATSDERVIFDHDRRALAGSRTPPIPTHRKGARSPRSGRSCPRSPTCRPSCSPDPRADVDVTRHQDDPRLRKLPGAPRLPAHANTAVRSRASTPIGPGIRRDDFGLFQTAQTEEQQDRLAHPLVTTTAPVGPTSATRTCPSSSLVITSSTSREPRRSPASSPRCCRTTG